VARSGLILDRDGTIVEERGYVTDPSDLVLIDGAAEAIGRALAAGHPVAVVTNQSAIGRGLLTEADLDALHEPLRALGISATYHCPHLPDAGCDCRKPKAGMVRRAIADLGLDAASSLLVGDHLTDCLAGRAAGVPAMLVRTGHGETHAADAAYDGFTVVDDVVAAIDAFLERQR
jgi:D-glycero-D-manno-heptose 1,7-bisphosphate phosphatase